MFFPVCGQSLFFFILPLFGFFNFQNQGILRMHFFHFFPLLAVVLFFPVSAHALTLTSPDISIQTPMTEEFVFNGYGCKGKNTSPALKWEGAPEGTKSFALTVFDPDAPTGGSGWWHWVIYNLPANSTGVPTGMGSGAMGIPKHVKQGRNDYGQNNYGGPCPPANDKPHRYIVTVYALNVEKLDVPDNASPAMIGFALNAATLQKAELVATYGRMK